MKKHRFYIAWIEGSFSAGGEKTGIRSQSDLKPEYEKGNPCIDAWEYECPEEVAWEVGAGKAFKNGWYAEDSLSFVEEI